MKSRVGKIAQLPKAIRDELNQRLENGKQGPQLLKWLNSLPETQEILTKEFENQPITKSNLSDWRQGGYRDWTKDKAREDRIHHLSESGNTLQKAEAGDLFENFARITVAELAADLDGLDDLKDSDTRWQRLRELTRELARLQNGYNRSRWAELAWLKYNDTGNSCTTVSPAQRDEPSTLDSRPSTPTPFAPVVPCRALSYRGNQTRYVHHAHCGCVCRKCHSEDGPYPYWDAERDSAARKSSELVQRENSETFRLHYWPCDCTCQRCDSQGLPEAPDQARKSVFRTIRNTKCECHGICPKCHAPDSEYPMTELLRDEALSREQNSSTIRHADGTSTCLRISYCDCPCEQCKPIEAENFQDKKFAAPKQEVKLL
jgi:hypothetical protein